MRTANSFAVNDPVQRWLLECLVARTVPTRDVGIGVLRDLLGNKPDNFVGPGNELFLEGGG